MSKNWNKEVDGLKHEYIGNLANFTYDFCSFHGIEWINSFESSILASIAILWWRKKDFRHTKIMQFRVMNSIRSTKKGKELFIDTGTVIDYGGQVGPNKPTNYKRFDSINDLSDKEVDVFSGTQLDDGDSSYYGKNAELRFYKHLVAAGKIAKIKGGQ